MSADPSGLAPASGESAPRKRRPLVWRIAQGAAAATVVALLGLLVWDVTRGTPGAGFVDRIGRGDKPAAPAFALPVIWSRAATWPSEKRALIGDGTLALRELRGTPVVLNFWASWCIPCKEEAPAFDAVARRYAGRVAFVGMDTQDFTGAAHRFLRKYKVNYVAVRDGTERTYRAYGLTGVPETYYIDPRGRVVAHAVGAVSARELALGVKALLREQG